MLDAFIIEELKRREQDRRRSERRPSLDIPVEPETPPDCDRSTDDEEEGERGVIIIDYGC